MQFDCTTIYAHTFVEIELYMHRAKRGAKLTVLITEEGTGDCRYPLEKGQARVYIKKNKRCSPFYEDCGTWLLDSREVNGQHIVRNFMHGLTRCGYKYLVTLKKRRRRPMRNIMKVTLRGAPGPDGKITGSVEEFNFEATVQYVPAALDEIAWRVIRLHLWTENADTSPTSAPCCVKYENGEWVSDPAHPREEAATQALIQRLRELPPPIRI